MSDACVVQIGGTLGSSGWCSLGRIAGCVVGECCVWMDGTKRGMHAWVVLNWCVGGKEMIRCLCSVEMVEILLV